MTWSDKDRQDAARLYATGLSYGQIGKRMGRSTNAIAGLAARNRDLFPKRSNDDAHSNVAVRMQMQAEQKKQADAQKQRLIALWAEGESVRNMARKTGLSAVSLNTMILDDPASFPPRKAAAVAVAPVPETAPVAAASVVADPVRFVDVGVFQCRAILSEDLGPDAPCCGARTVKGTSWCAVHFAAYTRPYQKTRARLSTPDRQERARLPTPGKRERAA